MKKKANKTSHLETCATFHEKKNDSEGRATEDYPWAFKQNSHWVLK